MKLKLVPLFVFILVTAVHTAKGSAQMELSSYPGTIYVQNSYGVYEPLIFSYEPDTCCGDENLQPDAFFQPYYYPYSTFYFAAARG